MLTSGIYLLPLSFCDILSKNHQTFLKVPIINFLLTNVSHDNWHQVQFCYLWDRGKFANFFGWDAAAICFQQTSCDGTSVKQSANRAQIHRNGFKLDQNSANKTEEVVHEFKLAQVSSKPM